MTVARTVALNAIFLSAARILNPLTSVILVSAIARTQGAAGLGEYSLVLTMFYMAVSLAGLGLSTPITRAVSVNRERAADFFIVASAVGLVFGLLAIAGVQALIFLLNYSPRVSDSANLLMLAVIPSVMVLHYDAIFIAHHKANYIAGFSIVENVSKVTIGLILLAMGKGIIALFVAIVCLRFITFTAYLVSFRIAIAPIVIKFNWAIVAELCKVSPVFTSNLVMSSTLGRIDIVLLSKLGDMADVGYYSAALRLVEIARLVPFSVKRAALPAMCETFYTKPDACKRLFDRCVKYMVVNGIGTALGIVVFATLLITAIYGEGFSDAETPLRIMALFMLPASLTQIFSCILFAGNFERLDFLANVAKIIGFVALSVFLIVNWGVLGAAIAYVAAEVILLCLMVIFTRAKIFDTSLLSEMRLPLVGALLGGVSLLLVPISAFLQMATTSAAAIGGLIALTAYLSVILTFDPVLRGDLAKSLHALGASVQKG